MIRLSGHHNAHRQLKALARRAKLPMGEYLENLIRELYEKR
jgi:hypothetical protein